jgi:hypothetical protein
MRSNGARNPYGWAAHVAPVAKRMVERIPKCLIAAGARRWLSERERRIRWWAGFRAFRSAHDPADLEEKHFLDLTRGWGNDGWSADIAFLRACIRAALTGSGPILECGSGLSTVLLAECCARNGRQLISLEDNLYWFNRVKRWLMEHGLESARLVFAPLRSYGAFDWYSKHSLPESWSPNPFDLVVCDGPASATRGGRFGLLPVMAPTLSARCQILMDDAEREDEQRIVADWARITPLEVHFSGGAQKYARVTLL